MAPTPHYDDEREMIAWAQSVTSTRFRDDAHAIGVTDDGLLLAVTVFDTFTPWDCQVHIVATEGGDWIDPTYMRHCCAYPFITCKLDRVSAQIRASNRPALTMARWMGFRREGLQRCAGPDRAGLVTLGMLRSECRWLPHPLAMSRQTLGAAI